MSRAAKWIAIAAVLIVVTGVLMNWYRIDFSRALALVKIVDPAQAQKLRNDPHLGAASQYLGESGLQTTVGVAALGAAVIAGAAAALAFFVPTLASSRRRLGGMVIFGCGVVVLAASGWGFLHRPNAAQLIDKLLNMPIMSMIDKGIEGLSAGLLGVGIGGSASLGLQALYPVANGIGIPVTLVGGLSLAASGLLCAMTVGLPGAARSGELSAATLSAPANVVVHQRAEVTAADRPARFCHRVWQARDRRRAEVLSILW